MFNWKYIYNNTDLLNDLLHDLDIDTIKKNRILDSLIKKFSYSYVRDKSKVDEYNYLRISSIFLRFGQF